MKTFTPEDIWKKYEEGENYLQQIDLHETVKKVNRFYNGDQWEGLNAPDLQKPVINIFKRSVAFLVSQVVSDDIGIDIKPQLSIDETDATCKMLKDEIDKVIENTKAKQKWRELERDNCIEGSGCWYFYFDPCKGTQGEICIDQIDPDKIIPDNFYIRDIQRQRGILLIKRIPIEELKIHARARGLSETEIDAIVPDGSNTNYIGEDKLSGNELCTVLMYFYKDVAKGSDKETVFFYECTKDVCISFLNTELEYYPIAWKNWEHNKGSFYGASAMLHYIPNQIYINKMWAMAFVFTDKMAFPTRFYSKSTFPHGLPSGPEKAVAVPGANVRDAVFVDSASGNMSSQVIEMVDKTIQYTRESMGVSDAALGNVRADNTSAIIALQRTTAMPLQLQRIDSYQFWEDAVRIIVDIIKTNYGLRKIVVSGKNEETGESFREITNFEFTNIRPEELELHVEVGESSYWSEINTVETLNHLLEKGIIDDAILFLKLLPTKYLSNKQEIIDELEKKKQQLLEQQQAQALLPEGETASAGEDHFTSAQENVPVPAESNLTKELAEKIKRI